MTSERIAIITGATDDYVYLLKGLVGSLRSQQPPATDLHVLDFGLSAASVAWLRAQGCAVLDPGRAGTSIPEAVRTAGLPHAYKAFLPALVPGYDLYVWLDADLWLQDAGALSPILAAAAEYAVAAVPEVDSAYHLSHRPGNAANYHIVKARIIDAIAGRVAAERLKFSPWINAGVFAARAASPFWKEYAAALSHYLHRKVDRHVDQVALLAAAAVVGDLNPMPATFNWMCPFARPRFDPGHGAWCTPFIPYQPIRILHLAMSSSLDYRAMGLLWEQRQQAVPGQPELVERDSGAA